MSHRQYFEIAMTACQSLAQGLVLKESEKCNWKEVQSCHVSHNGVENSTVLPLLKGSSALVVRDEGSEKG